jgi:uncharacterized membrane protein
MRRLRVFGHPLHPALVHLPLGLLLAAPVALLVGRFAEAPAWTSAARVCVELGLLCAVPAALAGVLDLLATPLRGAVGTVALVHVAAMIAGLCAFALAWYAWDRPDTALAFCLGGAAALVVGGAFGGHLVYVHRVGSLAEDV